MKSRSLNIIIKIAYILYVGFILYFIFKNSFASREQSSAQSAAVTDTINNFLKSINLGVIKDGIIRKIAHFTEFFILGGSLAFGKIIFGKNTVATTVYCIFFSVLCAMTDETIQYFTNRGSMLLDVWLDSFGAAIGILIITFIIAKTKRKV